MKKLTRFILAAMLCMMGSTASAQDPGKVITVYLNNGSKQSFPVSQIEYVGIEDASLTGEVEWPFDGLSTLPIMYINTDDKRPFNDETKSDYRLINDLVIANSQHDTHIEGAKFKGRGNSSWTFDKKSFTLKLESKEKLVGLPKHKNFALVANHSDKSLLRNSIAYQMGREIFTNMPWNPKTVHIHLVLNGEYMGLYMLTETAKIDSKRINVPNIDTCPSVAEAPKYGFLLEANDNKDEDFNFTTEHDINFSLKDPDGSDISEELCQYIRQYTQQAEDALYSNDIDKASQYIDLPSFVDWYLVNELGKNLDARYIFSCFLYYDPADGKLHSAPLWDFDIAFGNINYNDCDNPEGFHVDEMRWPHQLMQYDAVKQLTRQRWNEKKEELRRFCDTGIQAQADALSTEAGYNFTRWPILGGYIFPNAPGWEERLTYQSEIDYLKDFLRRRIDWLDENINAWQ